MYTNKSKTNKWNTGEAKKQTKEDTTYTHIYRIFYKQITCKLTCKNDHRFNRHIQIHITQIQLNELIQSDESICFIKTFLYRSINGSNTPQIKNIFAYTSGTLGKKGKRKKKRKNWFGKIQNDRVK